MWNPIGTFTSIFKKEYIQQDLKHKNAANKLLVTHCENIISKIDALNLPVPQLDVDNHTDGDLDVSVTYYEVMIIHNLDKYTRSHMYNKDRGKQESEHLMPPSVMPHLMVVITYDNIMHQLSKFLGKCLMYTMQ